MANVSIVTYAEMVRRTRNFGWELIDEKEAPLHFPFEVVDNPSFWKDLVGRNWAFAFYASFLYVVIIFGLQRWMRDRPAYQLKEPLFWWNFGLGIFSVLGFARTLPGLLHVLRSENGFYTSICERRQMDIQFGFWVLLFLFSKTVELGDTIFIVLRKRPLIFLQWYHHLATLSVTWLVAPLLEPITRWYTVMNFGVHAFMYNYFALKAKGVHVPNWIANIITTLQFSQMIMGLIINLLSIYYTNIGVGCFRDQSSIRAFGVVYGSFVILFGKLFYDSVLQSGKKKMEKVTKKID